MKTEIDKLIRERIRQNLIQCRIDHGFTQTQIGKLVDKSKNAVASWEQGLSLPDVETLYKLSVIYGVGISFMYGIDDDGNIK